MSIRRKFVRIFGMRHVNSPKWDEAREYSPRYLTSLREACKGLPAADRERIQRGYTRRLLCMDQRQSVSIALIDVNQARRAAELAVRG